VHEFTEGIPDPEAIFIAHLPRSQMTFRSATIYNSDPLYNNFTACIHLTINLGVAPAWTLALRDILRNDVLCVENKSIQAPQNVIV